MLTLARGRRILRVSDELREQRVRDEQQAVLKRMTPAQRLEAFALLYRSARNVKAAALRAFHPEWTEQQVGAAVREAFLYGRT